MGRFAFAAGSVSVAVAVVVVANYGVSAVLSSLSYRNGGHGGGGRGVAVLSCFRSYVVYTDQSGFCHFGSLPRR